MQKVEPKKYKEKIEYHDENETMIHVCIKGDVFEHYKSAKAIWWVAPEADGREGTVAKVVVTHEKLDESMPRPITNLDVIMVNVTEDIDAHLAKAWTLYKRTKN